MARGIPVELSTRSFPNKTRAGEFFREMRDRYRVGKPLNEADAADLEALLERHPDCVEKVGVGIDYFTTMRAPEYGTKCFQIVRTDGSTTDFSAPSAINAAPPPRKREVSQAFRSAVKDQINNARDAYFAAHADSGGKVPCAATKERVAKHEIHCDHRPPMTFEVLVTTFLTGRSLTVEQVPISAPADNQFSATITDAALLSDFVEYHRQLAQVDVIKKEVNLAQAARNRIRVARLVL
jgi:hypothetical protein